MAAKKAKHAPLTRDLVVGAALAIGDEEGLDAVSLRRLAGELGVTPMSVYNYVENKEALLDAVVDRVYGEVALPDPSRVDWWEGLALVARSARTALLSHPLAAAIVAQRPVSGPNALRIVETILALLKRAGFDLPTAVRISTAFTRFVISMIAYEAGLLPELPEDERRQRSLRTRFELESLPAGEYPNLVDAAPLLAAPYEGDTMFDQSLDLLRSGIEAQRPKRRV